MTTWKHPTFTSSAFISSNNFFFPFFITNICTKSQKRSIVLLFTIHGVKSNWTREGWNFVHGGNNDPLIHLHRQKKKKKRRRTNGMNFSFLQIFPKRNMCINCAASLRGGVRTKFVATRVKTWTQSPQQSVIREGETRTNREKSDSLSKDSA